MHTCVYAYVYMYIYIYIYPRQDTGMEMPSTLSEKRLREFLNAEVAHFASYHYYYYY